MREHADARVSLELLDRVLSREHGVFADDPSLLPSHVLQTLRLGDRPVPEGLTHRARDALRGRVWLELLERPPGFATAVGELARFELGGPVSDLSVLPAGDGLATLRLDGRLQMHRLPLGLPSWEVQAHAGPAEALDGSPSGRLLATADDAGAVALWDARTGAQLGAWSAHTGEFPTPLCWGPDDDLLVSAGGDGAIRIWRLASLGDGLDAECVHEMRSRDASTTMAIAWSPNGTRFATGGEDSVARLWTLGPQGPMLLAELDDLERGITSLAWDPGGTKLAGAAADATVCLWDLTEGTIATIRPREAQDPVRTIAWSPDGSRLAFDASAYRIGLFDAGRRAVTYLSGHRHVVFSLAWSPDGTLASCSTDWTARVWDPDIATQEEEAPAGHRTLIGGGIALSHDGDRLASGDYGSSIYSTYGADEGSGSEPRACSLVFRRVEDGTSIPGEHDAYTFRGVTAIAWARDDRQVALCCRDGSVATLDATTGHGEERWLAHIGEAWDVAWSPDGQIATAGQDGQVVVWGAQGAVASHSADAPVRALAWSPDGSRIAAGCDDGRVVCLRTPDLAEIWERLAHERRIHRITWSDDSRTLLTSSADGFVRAWGAESGTPLAEHRHGTQVYDAVLIEGQLVCSGGDEGTLDVWDADSGELVARAILPGSIGDIHARPADRIAVASHGSENGFRPAVYRFALRNADR